MRARTTRLTHALVRRTALAASVLGAVVAASPAFAEAPRPTTAGDATGRTLARPTMPPLPRDAVRMSLEDCIAMAARGNVDVAANEAEIETATASRGIARGSFGPRLRFEGNAQQWDGPFDAGFGGASFRVRDSFTWNASGSIIQPVTGLIAIYTNYKLHALGVDVAALERDVARRDASFHAIEAYYRLLEATRLVDVANASIERLDAQLGRARANYKNGVVAQDDVLRAELGAANARQRFIQQRARVTTARGRLATILGLPPSKVIDVLPVGDTPAPRTVASIEEAEQRSIRRLELRRVDVQIAARRRGETLAKERLLPQVNLVANYRRQGGSPLEPAGAAFVGAAAVWDAWDWGTTSIGIREAEGFTQQTIVARKKLEEISRLEARQAFVDVTTSEEALSVERTAVASAEENFRLVTKRYEAAAATSFDVIEAESLLTQARGEMQTALFDYLVSRAALQRATGEEPRP